jgi:DNA repair protein RecO
MPRYHRTEGICLRRLHFSNTSQIAGFLTPDAGRLSFMAKGVTRAPRSGVRTGFDLLSRYEIVYTARRPGALQNLTDRWLLEDFRPWRAGLEPMLCGYYAAELAMSFTIEGDPCPRLYGLLLRALRQLETGRALGLSVLRLEAGVLREHGVWPRFDACAECGGALPRSGSVTFDSGSGGPLCRRCESDPRRGAAARSTAAPARLLADLNRLSADTSAQPAPPPARIVAMSALLRFHMRDVLGRELRMWCYLQDRRLSRSLRRLRRRVGLQ